MKLENSACGLDCGAAYVRIDPEFIANIMSKSYNKLSLIVWKTQYNIVNRVFAS